MTLRPRSEPIGVTSTRGQQSRTRGADGSGPPTAVMTVLISALFISMLTMMLFPSALAAQSSANTQTSDGGFGQVLRVTNVDASDLGSVEVTVTVPSDFIESGVDLDSISVTEDGTDRPATARPITGPVQLGLVIDTSASMHGEPLAAAAQAARACLGGLPAGSTAFVVAYADQAVVTHAMSADLISVSRGLDQLIAVGETATYDALITTSAQFYSDPSRQPATPGSPGLDRFVVLLSDGNDNVSTTTLRQATDRLISDEATVYALALQTGETDIATLEQIVAATNGALITTTSAELVSHCTAISQQVANRYAVTYSSQRAGGTSATGAVGTSQVQISLGSGTGAAATTATTVDLGGQPGDLSDLIEPGTGSAAGGEFTPLDGAAGSTGAGELEIPLGVEAPSLAAGGPPPSELPMADAVTSAREAATSTRALWVGAGVMFAAMSSMFAIVLVPSQSAVTAKRLTLRVDTPKDTGAKRFGALGSIGDQVSSVIDSILARGRLGSALNASLDAAGINLRPGEYVAIFAGGAVGLFLFLAAAGFGSMAPFALVVMPALGYMYLKRRAKQRLNVFQEQLVETLMIMSGSIRAGHGMMQSIASVADQAEDPTAAEFGRVITEVRIGRDPIDSLNAMAERVKSIDLTWTVRAMALNRELGGNLAEILDNVSDTIRERNRIADQVRALSAEGKFSAYVLFGLPFGVVFAVRMLNAEYIEPLFNTSMGHKIIGIALGLMTVGAIWIKKMIKIEY